MQDYQKEFAAILAESGALFFAQGLRLKDGRPTPYFVNLGLFRTGRLSAVLGSYMARMLTARNIHEGLDVLVGPSYKGSAMAVATAEALWLEHGKDVLFDYDRKEAKTHGEATGQKGMFVTNALHPKARVVIIDDVGTSMGTKYDLINKLKAESTARQLGLSIIGVALAVDRQQSTAVKNSDGQVLEGVRGEDAIGRFVAETGIPVHTLARIRDVVHHLAESEIPVMINGVRRPLDPVTLGEFEDYMQTYGVLDRGDDDR